MPITMEDANAEFIGTENVQASGVRREYRPTGTNNDVAFSQYYRGGDYVVDSVFTPADPFGNVFKPPGVTDDWPPNKSQYSPSYALHEVMFRYTADIGIPSLANAYVYDTQVGVPAVPSPISWRWYWGQSNPQPDNARYEETVYGEVNANPYTGRPIWKEGPDTYFRPDGGWPYADQPVNHWQILLSHTDQRMTPSVVNYFFPYGGTVDLNMSTNIWGIWRGRKTDASTDYYNTTVPKSGQISLGNFRSQGNP